MNNQNIFQDLLSGFENDIDYKVESQLLEITEEICNVMKEKKINRANLATLLETSKSAVTKMLNGSANFTLKRLLKIAIALDSGLEIRFTETKKPMSFNVVETQRYEEPTVVAASDPVPWDKNYKHTPFGSDAGKKSVEAPQAA